MEDQSTVPLIRTQIPSIMNVAGLEIANLEDRHYFIWETSLHCASDMINKQVKHIPAEVCLISASAFAGCLSGT